MRGVQTLIWTTILALTVAAPAATQSQDAPANIPMAVAQPMTLLPDRLMGSRSLPPHVPESGLMMLVGSALIGLGTAMRRSTK